LCCASLKLLYVFLTGVLVAPWPDVAMGNDNVLILLVLPSSSV
jgi:hypothetical protein